MNFRISSKEFYNRQNQEIKRFLNNNKKTLHISLDQENTKNFPGQEQAEFLFVNDGSDLFFELNKLDTMNYDLIIITDLFELLMCLLTLVRIRIFDHHQLLFYSKNSLSFLCQQELIFQL